MPSYTIYSLGESQISISGGAELSGYDQGDGSHLVGETITLNSTAWETIDVDDSENNFEDTDSSQTLDGAQSFDGVSYDSGLRVEAEYQLVVQDPDGNSYTLIGFNINEPGGGASYGTVEGLAFMGGPGGFPPPGVPLTVVSASEGGSRPYEELATPVCFRAGSRIATETGPIRVEALAPGMRVKLHGGGTAEVRQVLMKRYPLAAVREDRRFWPVRIGAEALGPGRPRRAVELSPQHRVLVRDWRAQIYFGEEAVLVPAIKLTNGDSIRQVAPEGDLVYVHVALAGHEVLICEGLGCESFLGDVAQGLAAYFETDAEVAPPTALPAIRDRRLVCLR